MTEVYQNENMIEVMSDDDEGNDSQTYVEESNIPSLIRPGGDQGQNPNYYKDNAGFNGGVTF